MNYVSHNGGDAPTLLDEKAKPSVVNAELSQWEEVLADVKAEYLCTSQAFPWIIGFSGGKDSTVVAHAVFETLLSIPPSQRKREVHIVSNDTLVESPFVMAHLNLVTKKIAEAAEALGLPVKVIRTTPELEQTFWALLIGKGYPSPNSQMRWCTDRLKIRPTSTYIKNQVSACGSAIVVLGVRKSESSKRKRTIERHQNIEGTRLTPHSDLLGALIYRPIQDLELDDVWEILGAYDAPWGGTHSSLIKLYRDADGGECPVVLSKDDAPGCGTSSSRFGCWTCTVVEKDKSLQGFIDSGNELYIPLLHFRDWLKEIRNDGRYRHAVRRNGRLTFDLQGKHIPGPFTIKARQMILEKLLKTQDDIGLELISEAEISLIHKIWAQEISSNKDVADA